MKRKLFEIQYEFNFHHCGDPWWETHHLVVYEDGEVYYEDFMDDRIPQTVRKTIKNDCVDYFIRDIREIIKKYSSVLNEHQGLCFENFSDRYQCSGYMKFAGYKKIELLISSIYRHRSSIFTSRRGNGIYVIEDRNNEWVKSVIEEITQTVNHYCLEKFSFTCQLGFKE